jgi:signal transduction histidine kinase
MSRILIANADPRQGEALQNALAGLYDVDVATDGWTAIEKICEQPPDMVVANVQMPGVNGLGVLAAVRAKVPSVPVVLTGPGNVADALDALRFGADDYILEPVEPSCMQAAVRRVLCHRTKAAELEKRVAQLERANAFKTHLLRTTSHDITNLLTSLKGYAYLAEHASDLEDARDYIRIMLDTVHGIQELASELTTYGMLDARALRLRPELFELGDAMRQAAATTWHDPSRHHIHLPTNTPEVYADRRRTTQILTNLLGNAVKYSPRGGNVVVDASREGAYVVCSVRDEGIGIAPDQMEKIFQPYVRLEPHEGEQPGGTGLGLSIVRNLVELQGGRIRAQAAPGGKGTLFVFTLPAAPPERKEQP